MPSSETYNIYHNMPTGRLSDKQFLCAAAEAFLSMSWKIEKMTDAGCIACNSKYQRIKISLDSQTAYICAETPGQIFTRKINRKNLNTFLYSVDKVLAETAEDQWAALCEKQAAYYQPGDTEDCRPVTDRKANSWLDFASIFIPRPGYFVTPVIIDINILIFILMCLSGVSILSPDSDSLLKWGANFRPLTLDGQWWRLLTNCFLHIGIIHILMNMYALLYVGIMLEPLLGRKRFAFAYILTGIAASVNSLWWHDMTISAGASGAIFGMYGVFLAMLTTNLIEKHQRSALLSSIGIFVAYNLFFGMKSGVDNAAHIGGLISGLLIGYGFWAVIRYKATVPGIKIQVPVMLTVIILAFSVLVIKSLPHYELNDYQQKMNRFVDLEYKANAILAHPEPTRTQIMADIRQIGIPSWQTNKRLIIEADKLSLPDNLHERNKVLLHYCDLRLRIMNVIYKAADSGTDQYNDSIQYYGNEIKELLDTFKQNKQ
jgi:rhomboid protease GluP